MAASGRFVASAHTCVSSKSKQLWVPIDKIMGFSKFYHGHHGLSSETGRLNLVNFHHAQVFTTHLVQVGAGMQLAANFCIAKMYKRKPCRLNC
eukprot:2644642-Pleurochrysis_carterae.AAC.1